MFGAKERAIADGIEDLFRSYWPLVVGYLRRRTGNDALAEELAAETFARAVAALLGWRRESPAGWLLAIARNVHLDHARRARRVVPFEASMLLEAPVELAADAQVRELLAALPDATTKLLRLVYEDGFTHAEVAALTDSTPSAVRTAVWRARQEFRIAWEQARTEDTDDDDD